MRDVSACDNRNCTSKKEDNTHCIGILFLLDKGTKYVEFKLT